MDKFEIEQFSQLGDIIDELQFCFLDEDAYSRTPSPHEWRRATAIVHRLKLAFCELLGYAKACRQFTMEFTRERLHVVPGDKGGDPEQGQEKKDPDAGTSGAEQGFVEFTEQEIKQMPAHFRKLIIINKKRCRLRKHASGKKSYTYEIRFRQGGYDISACGKTIELAKANMIEKMKTAKPNLLNGNAPNVPTTFQAFTLYYFETKRIRLVVPKTYKTDLSRCKNHLFPHFGKIALKKITLGMCQTLIDSLMEKGHGKTASEVLSLMNCIFAFAKDNHLITNSPCDAVILEHYDVENGVALTKDEEKQLLNAYKNTRFGVCFAIALYTGLRPNEYTSAVVSEDQNFIIAMNSKQKKKRNGEIVYKKIAIPSMLRPYITANPKPYMYTAKYLRKYFKAVLPDHILYDMRTTFHTRCKECKIDEAARHAFMGHSLKAVDKAYTDLSDAYLLSEGKKLVW